jgi:hypothetical protein
MMRSAIEDRGLSGLVAKSGEEAAERIKTELEGGQAAFDPLMSMNWHFSSAAIECGGLTQGDDGKPRCPLCEFEKNTEGFDPKMEIEKVIDQMRVHCLEKGLISKPV